MSETKTRLFTALHDAAAGALEVRSDLRAALSASAGLATILIEQELDLLSAQVHRLKRMADMAKEL